MFNFDDDFLFNLNNEDIATLFFQAKPLAETLRQGPACEGLTEEDAKLMSTSFAVAVALLRAYSGSQGRNDEQTR